MEVNNRHLEEDIFMNAVGVAVEPPVVNPQIINPPTPPPSTGGTGVLGGASGGTTPSGGNTTIVPSVIPSGGIGTLGTLGSLTEEEPSSSTSVTNTATATINNPAPSSVPSALYVAQQPLYLQSTPAQILAREDEALVESPSGGGGGGGGGGAPAPEEQVDEKGQVVEKKILGMKKKVAIPVILGVIAVGGYFAYKKWA